MEQPSLTARITSRLRDSVFAIDVPEAELESPRLVTIFKILYNALRTFKVERAATIFGSAFLLLMVWGFHGNLDLLKFIVPGWRGPGVDIGARPQLIPGLPWDNELISFWGGVLLVVIVPILLIKFVYKQPLSEYGLGLPPRNRWKLAVQSFLIAVILPMPLFLLATRDAGMRATYPFYRPFTGVGQFVLYELTYLPFFIAIEFIFRGYLLFGLAGLRDARSARPAPDRFYVGKYALLIQMLSYTAWHLGKPLPELWGTLAWGLCAGIMAYTTKSLWPVIGAHWLLNVVFDAIVVLTM